MNRADYSALDETLDLMAPMGPDLANGFSNHAPMAIEAMCAMRRGDAVMPWFEDHRASLAPRRARVAVSLPVHVAAPTTRDDLRTTASRRRLGASHTSPRLPLARDWKIHWPGRGPSAPSGRAFHRVRNNQ